MVGAFGIVSPMRAQFNLGKAMDAAKDVAKSESLSDAELKSYFDQMAADTDRQNPIAPADNPYDARTYISSKFRTSPSPL
jgi:putative metalloprotease